MPKIAMLNQEGAKVGEIELSEAIFASEINESVLHLVVRSQLAAKRQGTQSAKTRGEVRGVVMNPCDHPHGGGEGKSPVGLPAPVTPWGKPALGLKTRKHKKYSDKKIVKRAGNK